MPSPTQLLTELPYGLPGKIYRSPMPFSPLFDPDGQLLDAYLDAGVDTVLMLTEPDEVLDLTGQDLRTRYQMLGFKVVEVPVVDFSVPQEDPFRRAIEDTLQAVREGQTIVVHCHAGVGRTGMFTACLAKQVLGLDGRAAVNWVRRAIPNAVENLHQYQFVIDY